MINNYKKYAIQSFFLLIILAAILKCSVQTILILFITLVLVCLEIFNMYLTDKKEEMDYQITV